VYATKKCPLVSEFRVRCDDGSRVLREYRPSTVHFLLRSVVVLKLQEIVGSSSAYPSGSIARTRKRFMSFKGHKGELDSGSSVGRHTVSIEFFVMYRIVTTSRACPILCTLSTACASTIGFQCGSTRWTKLAAVRSTLCIKQIFSMSGLYREVGMIRHTLLRCYRYWRA
jgi:hypothetical protein